MRKISIEPLTRVEGHGRVDLFFDPDGFVDARLSLIESPRLFEGILLGRSFRETPALVCRICAICSSAHRIAATVALEAALGVKIPPLAKSIRELLLLGGHIESHALHLFCLVLPDLRGVASVFDLLRSGDTAAGDGMSLKKLGNRIQEVAGGRVIHPVNVEVGGVLHRPEEGILEELTAELKFWKERIGEIFEIFGNSNRYPPCESPLGTRISVDCGPEFSLMGESLALSEGECVPGTRYRELLGERPVLYSNAKLSRRGSETFLTGALARLENAGIKGVSNPDPGNLPEGIYGNNAAQAVEIEWALERCLDLMEKIRKAEKDEPLSAEVRAGPGAGTAILEAPRGLLIHNYVLDDMGRVAAADIVTPTAINQGTMERQLRSDIRHSKSEMEAVNTAERIVRAYDPCISCSVHVIRV